jgi:hypothetical protein
VEVWRVSPACRIDNFKFATTNAGLASAEDVPGNADARHDVLIYNADTIFWNAGISGKEESGRSRWIHDDLVPAAQAA